MLRYSSVSDVQPLFRFLQGENAAIRSGQLPDADHPYPLILGPSVWSQYPAIEIRYEGGLQEVDIKTGRWLAAQLLLRSQDFLGCFSNEWRSILQDPGSWSVEPSRLWYQAFHLAAAQVLFVSYRDRLRYLELCRSFDAAKLRVSDDRRARYDAAVKLLKGLSGQEPWTTDRPESHEEADALLYREFDAFRFSPRGSSILYVCFTTASLARRCGLHLSEADDFIEHIKSQGLIESRTHPVTFPSGRQKRYTCIPASGGAADD